MKCQLLASNGPSSKSAMRDLRESVRLMRQLWTEERVNFEGEYYRTEQATIYDRPDEPIPVYVAAAGPMVARYAGRVGDGYITTSGKAPELYTEKLVPSVKEGIEKAERNPKDVDMMLEVKVSFDTDKARAMDDTKYWAALALKPEEKMGVEDPMEMEKLADALPAERAASRWIVSDDPEEQVERIRPYVEMGFNHLVFHGPGPDQARFIKLYSEHVMPLLRKAFG